MPNIKSSTAQHCSIHFCTTIGTHNCTEMMDIIEEDIRGLAGMPQLAAYAVTSVFYLC